MPIEIGISDRLDLVYGRWSGRIDLQTIVAMLSEYHTDPNFVQGRRELCDFSDVSDLDVSFKEAWSILSTVNAHETPKARRTQVYLYAPQDTAFGLARMYQSLADFEGGVEVIILTSEAEALTALGLDYGSLAKMRAEGGFVPLVAASGQAASGLLCEPDA